MPATIASGLMRGDGMRRGDQSDLEAQAVAGKPGRIRKAPENFLDAGQIASVASGRRDFLRGSFIAAAPALGAGRAIAQEASAQGDEEIL